MTYSVRFKIVIKNDFTSLKPAYAENSSSCIMYSYSQYNIYWDEVALVFFVLQNYSQETLSNALSDYTKYKMGRNCLVLQGD